MSNVAPQSALMIGLGVGVDYALFIVTRFRENYLELGDIERSAVAAMDTSGRAILLAGTTVVIALLGMFATGISFMYGLAVASVIAVLLDDGGFADAAPSGPVALRRSARGLTGLAPAAVRAAPDKHSGGASPVAMAAVERDRAGASPVTRGRIAGSNDRAAATRIRAAAGRE